MNKIIAILLIFSTINMGLSRIFVFADFEMNRNYIAKVLCVNKNKPKMHCNGKCYLSKKLKQIEEKEKKEQQENQKKDFSNQFFQRDEMNLKVYGSSFRPLIISELKFKLPQTHMDVPHPPPSPAFLNIS